MSLIKKIIVVLLAGTIVGCTQVIIRKAFKSASVVIQEETKVAFRVEQTVDKKTSGVTVYGQPYKLLAFVNYKMDHKNISLRDLNLSGENGATLRFPDKEKQLSLGIRPVKGSIIIEYDIGDIEYQPYTLAGELIYETSADKTTYSIDVLLDTDYKEEKVNIFWEGIMGI